MADYLKPWHWPLLGVFLVSWLVFGGYLFQLQLAKHSGRRRVDFGDGFTSSLFSGGMGLFVAILPLGIVILKIKSIPSPIMAVVLAAILAAVLFFGVGLLTFACMHQKLSTKQSTKIATLPLVAILLLGTIIATACTVPVLLQREARIAEAKKARQTQHNMEQIGLALIQYPKNLPDSLDDLVGRTYYNGKKEKKTISADMLKVPILDNKRAFIYAKPSLPLTGKDRRHQLLLIVPPCRAIQRHKSILALTTSREMRSIPLSQLENDYLADEVNAHLLPLKAQIFKNAD